MKIDATALKEKLSVEDVIGLLQELGSSNHVDERSKGYIMFETICHRDSNGSMKLYYYIDSCQFYCYTTCSCSFDIYELVRRVYEQKGIELHFSSIVEIVSQKTGNSLVRGFGSSFVNRKKEVIDDWDWINKVSKRKIEIPEPETYSDKMLDAFSEWHHPIFTDDHITPETMREFNIKFSERERRIVIPHYYHKDPTRIIGMRGRTIDKEEEEAGRKYFPVSLQGKMYNFSTYQSLFGLAQNQDVIRRLRKAAIFESEKSVMQCHSYYGDNNFSLALSGKNISQHQIDMLLELGIEELIFCYDKMFDEASELDEDFLKYVELVTSKVQRLTPFVRVFVAYDKFGLQDRDDSPSDSGVEVLNSIMHTKVEVATVDERVV